MNTQSQLLSQCMQNRRETHRSYRTTPALTSFGHPLLAKEGKERRYLGKSKHNRFRSNVNLTRFAEHSALQNSPLLTGEGRFCEAKSGEVPLIKDFGKKSNLTRTLIGLCLVLVAFFGTITDTYSQAVNLELVRLRTRGLGPTSREDMTQNLTFIELTVRNNGTRAVPFRVAVEFSTNGNILLQTLNDRTPVYTIQPNETMTLLTPQIFRLGAFAGPTIQQPPLLPVEGNYDVCLRVTDPNNEQLVYVSRGCLTSIGSGPVSAAGIQAGVKRIMGIPATVTGVLRVDGGYQLSGRITLPTPRTGSTFTYSAGREVNFFDVFFPLTAFQPTNPLNPVLPEDVSPENDILPLLDTELEVTFRGWLPMIIRNDNGLSIRRDPNYTQGTGAARVNLPVIRDKMFLNVNRFLQEISNSGASDEIQVVLQNGSTGTLANNDNRIPGVLFSSTQTLTIAGGLTAVNGGDVSWRLFGFDLGQLDKLQLVVSDTNMVVNGDMPLRMLNTTSTAAKVRLAFSSRGQGADRVTSSVNIPQFRLGRPGTPAGSTLVGFSSGFFTLAGIRMTGVVTCATRSLAPVEFDASNLDITRQGPQWRFGDSRLVMRYSQNNQIRFTPSNRQAQGVSGSPVFAFEDAIGSYNVIGVGTSTFRSATGTSEKDNYNALTTITYRTDSTMRIASPATEPQRYDVPTSRTPSSKPTAGGLPSTASVRNVQLVIDSVQTDPRNTDRLIINGGLDMEIAPGMQVVADTIIISKRTGIVAIKANLNVDLPTTKGVVRVNFNAVRNTWEGVGNLFFSAQSGGLINSAVTIKARFKYENSQNWDVNLMASKQPGIKVYPPQPPPPNGQAPPSTGTDVWLSAVQGAIRRKANTWNFTIAGLFSIFDQPDNDVGELFGDVLPDVDFPSLDVELPEVNINIPRVPGKARVDVLARGNMRSGGSEGVVLDLIAEKVNYWLPVDEDDDDIKTGGKIDPKKKRDKYMIKLIGEGDTAQVSIFFSDMRVTGKLRTVINWPDVVDLKLAADLDIYPSKQQYVFDARAQARVINAFDVNNARVVLAYQYPFSFSDPNTGLSVRYNSFTGLFGGAAVTFIDQSLSTNIDLGIADISLSGSIYAAGSAYMTVEPRVGAKVAGISVPSLKISGGAKMYGLAQGSGRVVGVRLAGFVEGNLEGSVSGGFLQPSKYSGSGKFTLEASARIGRCSASCNSADICVYAFGGGAAAKICFDIGAGFSIDSGTGQYSYNLDF